ncbi:helix-turn-helix transcriptional regulator [Chryseobacterium sp.]|uniref:helix-turn-helix domain-containing protein n=1 Tax=Chryseobacterium sp. TaxID=1871047 RepID=UPI0024E1C207|nr:helix-turn-helix transcriptional regulator [Chryseobacterium sp.]
MKVMFGEYIRELRTNNHLTLTQLAARLELDSANLSKIENGKRDFDERRLEKLADVFNLDIEKLKGNILEINLQKKCLNTIVCLRL